MELSTSPETQALPQRFYALEQLSGHGQAIRLIADALPVCREQMDQLLSAGQKAKAYEVYQTLERQRDALTEQLRAVRPLLLELEHPLASAAAALAAQMAAFRLMTRDYGKLSSVLRQFSDQLPTNQATNAAVIGRLMNNVRMGHYPTDLDHVDLITRGIAFPSGVTTNLLDPCCGTGAALRRMATGNNCFCYGVELDHSRAEQAQSQLHHVGFGSFFGSRVSQRAFHVIFLNPPYLSVLTETGGRSRNEKRFLLESIPLLTWGGLMVYIVPYYRMTEDICRVFCDHFEQVSIHRFLDSEFKKFKQVAVLGLRRRRTDDEAAAAQLCEAALRPDRLPTLDLLEAGRYALPAQELRVETFRGAEFNEDELARQLKRSESLDRLLAVSKRDSAAKRPPLPLSVSQVGLIGGSGLINGLMECEYPHIIKGRIVKERRVTAEENRSHSGKLISTEYRETISNRMMFNLLTPNGLRSLA
ncbi:MAG: class I SAM-dependent methyltransferase [Oscillospiraceae bacterium]|nr:class I SAM-dependent methyltransferase [Oscillospiraceae bacterium]